MMAQVSDKSVVKLHSVLHTKVNIAINVYSGIYDVDVVLFDISEWLILSICCTLEMLMLTNLLLLNPEKEIQFICYTNGNFCSRFCLES